MVYRQTARQGLMVFRDTSSKGVQNDIIQMIQGFFLGDYLHRRVTAITLTLIPKVDKPRSLADYRPMSLSNFTSKMVSKILATRLAEILPSMINEQQSGFVKGMSIHESIAVAQELVSELDRKVVGGNIIFKFDMSKAYDRVEWRFILAGYGFLPRVPRFGVSEYLQYQLPGLHQWFLQQGISVY